MQSDTLDLRKYVFAYTATMVPTTFLKAIPQRMVEMKYIYTANRSRDIRTSWILRIL